MRRPVPCCIARFMASLRAPRDRQAPDRYASSAPDIATATATISPVKQAVIDFHANKYKSFRAAADAHGVAKSTVADQYKKLQQEGLLEILDVRPAPTPTDTLPPATSSSTPNEGVSKQEPTANDIADAKLAAYKLYVPGKVSFRAAAERASKATGVDVSHHAVDRLVRRYGVYTPSTPLPAPLRHNKPKLDLKYELQIVRWITLLRLFKLVVFKEDVISYVTASLKGSNKEHQSCSWTGCPATVGMRVSCVATTCTRVL